MKIYEKQKVKKNIIRKQNPWLDKRTKSLTEYFSLSQYRDRAKEMDIKKENHEIITFKCVL